MSPPFGTQCALTEICWTPSLHLVVSAKVILFRHTFSCLLLMVCLVLSGRKLRPSLCVSYTYAGVHRVSPTFYLPRIVSYSLKAWWIKQILLNPSLIDMNGQLVSLGKCSIMYGESCSNEVQAEIKQILKYETTCFKEKYLGLPVPEGRLTKGKFKSTKGKFTKHASDWSERYMSSGAKDILIKSILQSVSTYAMGVFKFPTGLIGDLEHIIRDFWWGDEVNKRKMHWLSWDKVARPKGYGGTGFCDLQMFNQALLARQAWRLIDSPDSLCARLLKARYYQSGHLLDTAFIQNQSQSWQGIVHGLELLKE